ncbi:type II toxin-antitoxin system RelB/DinJ family antitoxin [Fibrobacter sp.]|uniref:type II toxin-antitoxin system RelB/DinJ family antitoxin n=1 Tax=Fibrobacter sp. TaxID=35828 RepID=UPI0026099170|nr:type II toxin-antitoxin system RelB/DinJ family antitoxin [Fibrobacter sp.]MDD5942746.1 type II toxin-antitoxin system RelB/DinJ family antitoxin [Fibrobacter sp.]
MATTVLQVCMDEDLKNEASELFEKLGLDIPTAIRIFFKRAVTEKGIPFELREPTAVYNAGVKDSVSSKPQIGNGEKAQRQLLLKSKRFLPRTRAGQASRK